MENSCLFIRGQVWYWEDPIYGRKENNLEVSIGEAVLRYNRYCVVSQTTETIDKSSVLVIPCSSSNHTPHDVPAPLAHVFHENFTYARTRGIFPVHPKFLQRYICTLPENVMKQIEGELIKLLIPSITENMSEDNISSILGIDINSPATTANIQRHEPMLEVNVRSFIRDHLVKADPAETISAYELKDAFNQYCIIHDMVVVDDIVEFLEIFTKVTNNPGYRFTDKPRYNLVEFRGLRIRGNLKLSIMMSERDLINSDDPQRPGRWNDDSIADFILTCDGDGIEEAAAKFGLKPTTATNYWYKWKDRLSKVQPPSVKVKIPTTVDTPRSISKIANMVRDNLRDIGMYHCIETEISETAFYSTLGSCIYYSLLDFMSIRKDESGNFFCPNINENSKYLSTWHFFDRAYHDKHISLNKTGPELMSAYRKYFPNDGGIDENWINRLKYRITNRLSLSQDDMDKICDIIKEEYC